MDEICALCKEHNVPLIEDAAESLGTTYKGKMTGTFGDYGIYSFNGNKIITTSGGGILVAKQEKDVDKARFLSRQARDPARHYQHSTIGYNYRMSNVVAGIGCGQMQHTMHLQPVFEEYDFIRVEDGISVSEDIFNRGLCLPSDIKNTKEDIERIIKIVRKQFRQQ